MREGWEGHNDGSKAVNMGAASFGAAVSGVMRSK